MVIPAREKDLGGLVVRRTLPHPGHRMVGPFIFFDHFGPIAFEPGLGLQVRPHPHIGLATVTYLFEGAIRHRDSLGSDLEIQPGAINWMTAGRGIVHSERQSSDPNQQNRAHGLQCWVALPEMHETTDPSFSHHPAESIPRFRSGSAEVALLIGAALGQQSPVPVHSDVLYLEVSLTANSEFRLEAQPSRELAVYIVAGEVTLTGQRIGRYSMAVLKPGIDLVVRSDLPARVMILGGESLGPRHIYWNFVASSKSQIEEAKRDWSAGPRLGSERFHPIPGDDGEFIPLPVD